MITPFQAGFILDECYTVFLKEERNILEDGEGMRAANPSVSTLTDGFAARIPALSGFFLKSGKWAGEWSCVVEVVVVPEHLRGGGAGGDDEPDEEG